MNVPVRSRDSHHMPPLLHYRLRIQTVTTPPRENPGEPARGAIGAQFEPGLDQVMWGREVLTGESSWIRGNSRGAGSPGGENCSCGWAGENDYPLL